MTFSIELWPKEKMEWLLLVPLFLALYWALACWAAPSNYHWFFFGFSLMDYVGNVKAQKWRKLAHDSLDLAHVCNEHVRQMMHIAEAEPWRN